MLAALRTDLNPGIIPFWLIPGGLPPGNRGDAEGACEDGDASSVAADVEGEAVAAGEEAEVVFWFKFAPGLEFEASKSEVDFIGVIPHFPLTQPPTNRPKPRLDGCSTGAAETLGRPARPLSASML